MYFKIETNYFLYESKDIDQIIMGVSCNREYVIIRWNKFYFYIWFKRTKYILDEILFLFYVNLVPSFPKFFKCLNIFIFAKMRCIFLGERSVNFAKQSDATISSLCLWNIDEFKNQ